MIPEQRMHAVGEGMFCLPALWQVLAAEASPGGKKIVPQANFS